ncbi:MAG: hypothetical protein ACI4RN_07070 [Oscillospiraceae bacterium]
MNNKEIAKLIQTVTDLLDEQVIMNGIPCENAEKFVELVLLAYIGQKLGDIERSIDCLFP